MRIVVFYAYVASLLLLALVPNFAEAASTEKTPISAATFHLPATSEEKFLDKTLRDADRDDAVTPWLFDNIPSTKETTRTIVANFSTGFISALQKREQSELDEKCQGHMIEGELCGLEYSPLVCAQEDNDYHFVYRTVSSNKKEVLIAMRWDVPNSPEPMATYKLKKIRGHWQVDGISCTGREAFNMEMLR